MGLGQGLNQAAKQLFLQASERAEPLRVQAQRLACGAQLLDFGVHVPGGLQAGLQLASLCMAGQSRVQLASGPQSVWPGPWVQVQSDHPLQACMLAQYAGWPVQHDKFFAMGSGPMRLRRGKEDLLESLGAGDTGPWAVGTLECDALPAEDLAMAMAAECGTPVENLCLAVAPTRSIAGGVQVVARSVETCLHKLHELGFELSAVHSAYGLAPLPPSTPDFALGIGRTNDAILYGGRVSLWVDADDEQLQALGAKLPSSASADFGQPFASIFKRCNYDFYKIDPGLFSPAEITLLNLRSGCSWRFGELRGDLLAQSFQTQQA
ncbi:MAG: methenyltetrahydromethanopterin cyclohydrolase [Planctomycetales bacterium]|nr:methenyltetrahydromethanopterin cyclohydrolase [Planctomycetales bacterium]